MKYVYFGLEQIKDQLHKYENVMRLPRSLYISFTVDGLPLYKSSATKFWLITCRMQLSTRVDTVFPVAILSGPYGPNDTEFLHDLIHALPTVVDQDIPLQHNNRSVRVLLRGVICDAPARALVKAIPNHTGYSSSKFCTQRGDWHGRMTFQRTMDLEYRTDNSFRQQTDVDHHKGISPFTNLPQDTLHMISHFPLDYMHVVCIGVTKRLLLIWLESPVREHRLSQLQKDIVSGGLIRFGKSVAVPEIFARKPRSLIDIRRWKATELRQFLLYSGRIVLKPVLHADKYEHFCSLSIAIAILVCPRLSEYRQYANRLLRYFVQRGRELYGQEFIVYNVHQLLHLASCCEMANSSLDDFSCFASENFLQLVKRLVRSGNNPLEQVACRLYELRQAEAPKSSIAGPTTKAPANAYIIGEDTCCELIRMYDGIGECRVYQHPMPLFDSPCSGRIIGCYKCQSRSVIQRYPLAEFRRRALMVESDDAVIYISILHDYG
jgi:hypothetical protein